MPVNPGLPLPFLLLVLATSSMAADGLTSKTTYQQAYGASKGSPKVDPAKELPRYPPVEPRDAVATWQVKEGFRLEIAAHEPAVRDPIAICFDERGRMFVCEMIDYSEMRDAKPHLGRISVLEDRDGDGIFETSQVFAEDLPWPTGLIWAHGGLYVAATPDIWRLEDRDGDGRAEIRTKAYTGFGTGLKLLNVQGLANSLQWGPDNRVHVLAGGGNRGKVSCPARPEMPPLELGGQDFWFDPLTQEFGLEPGGAQYGMSFDDYGRKFGCSNSDHLQYWVHTEPAIARNLVAPLPSGRTSIAADGGAAEVFRISPDEPWRIIRTRWRIAGTVPGVVEGGGRVSGYFTGATGTTIYRGDAYGPSFLGNSFTGDAGGQLIHRKVITPAADGVGLTAARPSDEARREFAASRDTWVRAVNFANAPDGCLYACDMYREVIEHPWSIPDEIKRNLDLNSGNDRGRIYRLIPTAGLLAGRGTRVDLVSATDTALVAALSHPNGWHRDTASRLLIERHAVGAGPALTRAASTGPVLGRLHALTVLHGLGLCTEDILHQALTATEGPVRERGLQLLRRQPINRTISAVLREDLGRLVSDPLPRVRFELALTLSTLATAEDPADLGSLLAALTEHDSANPWITSAALSARPEVLHRSVRPRITAQPVVDETRARLIERLLETSAWVATPTQLDDLLDCALIPTPEPGRLRAIQAGLTRRGSTLGAADTSGRLAKTMAEAAQTCADPTAQTPVRERALRLLVLADDGTRDSALRICLSQSAGEQLQLVALRLIAEKPAPKLLSELPGHWQQFGAKGREELLHLLLTRPESASLLLKAVEQGRVPGQAFSPEQIQALIRHPQAALREQARKVLAAQLPPSRADVIARFTPATGLKGDAAAGRTIYEQRCLPCHRAGAQGFQVGPDLVTVKNKGREALLTAILDPDKEVAAQYAVFNINTKQGETLTGLITEDSATGLTLLGPGGQTRTLARADVAGSNSSGRSLMPEGLEAGLSPQDLANLLTFIEELP